MAKKKEDSAEESEKNKSIGSLMTGKLSQRDRNLLVKQELIDKGEREEPKQPTARGQKERNLLLKKELRDAEEQVRKLAEKDEKNKSK